MKIEQGGPQNHEDEFGGSPTVEKDAKQKNDNVFVSFFSQIVGDKKGWKKEEKENDTAKDHFFSISGLSW
jgi:hypothetical protein